MGRTKEKLWSLDLVLAAVVNFCLAFVFYLLMTTMAVYAVAQFAVSDTGGGFAASIYVVGATSARLVAGNLVDLVGRRRILVIALVVYVVAALSYFLVENSYGGLLVVRCVHGVAFGIASTAAMALAQSVIPRSRHAEGTGYFTLSTTLATAIGPFLALQLVDSRGYNSLFIAAVVAAALALVLALFLRAEDEPLDPERRAHLRRFHPRSLLNPAVVPVAAFMHVMAICYSGVLTYLEAYAAEEGLQSGASMFFLVYAVVLLVSRLIAGRVQDLRGDNIVVFTAIASFAVGQATLALAGSNVTVVIAAGFMGLGFGTLMSAMQAVAVSKVPRDRIGSAISTQFFMIDFGIGIGPVLLGFLLTVTGFATMYAVLSGVVLAGGVLYYAAHGRRHGGAPATAQVDRQGV